MLQNVAMGGCDIAPACAKQVISTSLPTPLGMGYSRAHVAATILSSLFFGLVPNIAAAQSHLPQCPSDRNQVWTDCRGVYGHADGSRYVGEFRDNKRSGQGALTFANGDKYVGEWSDGKENGQGTYTFVGGNKYVGDWRDSKRNGRGTQTYSDGSSYVGEWRDDQKSGRGTQTYSDGSSYVGEFRGDKRNGQGVLTWPNRDKYVGEWRDNKENGQGTYVFADGGKYAGEVKDEAPKHTLTDENTLANGETAKEMDRAHCRGPTDRSTWVNSRTTYKAGK